MNTNENNPYNVGQPKSEDEKKAQDSVGGFMFTATGEETYYRSMSAHSKCKECNYEGPSHVDQTCSFVNCCFCYCCAQYWFLYMIFKNKDINCKNAHHKCGSCSKTLYNYRAC